MRVSSLLPFCSLILALSAPTAAGQPQSPPAPPTDVPFRFAQEVVVTPTRREEPMANVPGPVIVITSSAIEQSTARDIPELLRTHAGVHVADITGNRRSYRVDMRGFGETASSNTLVLVDGRRVTLPDLSGTDWLQIPLNRVDRVEVTRGGRGSVLYGDNATAGAINIITKDGGSQNHSLAVSAASYSTFDVGASANGVRDSMSYAAEASYQTSDGYRANGDTEAGDLGLTMRIDPNQIFSLMVSAGVHGDTTGLPGELKESDLATGASRRSTSKPDEFAEVNDVYIMVQPRVTITDRSVASLDVSFRKRGSAFFSSFAGGTFDGDTTVDTLTVSPQLVLAQPIAGHDNTFVIGADMARSTEDIINTTVFGGTRSVGTFTLEKRNTGVFFHDELFPIARLGLSGGYRYDRVTYEFMPSTPSSVTYDQHLTTVGLNYRWLGTSRLYAGFSRSFRYPLLDELFNFFSNTIETRLRPQRSDNYEAGIRGSIGNAAFGAVNYFLVGTDDEIFFNPTGGAFGFGANENLDGRSRRHGVEILAGGLVGEAQLNGHYTYTEATVQDGALAGRRVPNVPRHRATLNGTMRMTERLTVSLDGTYVGRRLFESDYPNVYGEQEGYVVANLRLRYDRGGISNFVDIRNLFDREYAEYGVLGGFPVERAFFPSPGINVRVGSSVTF